MSLFFRKNKEICASEIETVSEYINNVFNAQINLERLKDQIESLIEQKIADYHHNRFKDWAVADLILLTNVLSDRILKEKSDIKPKKLKKSLDN